VGPDSGSFVVAGLPGVNMSQGLSRNNHSNRSLTVAAQNPILSRDRKGAVLANWHGHFLTHTQDPIEYNSFTWHTNLDTCERVVPEDLMDAAIVVAAEVWDLANRDAMLPRFTKEQMPADDKDRAESNPRGWR
jgi:hypothetical protein